ncbi:retrovirus-related pol polyprotein from transposon TNT 1-94 [Tanacetum coccineum]
MTTLVDKSLLSRGDNKPPMLEKHLYDSWKSRMELCMLNRPHGRMILASVEKGPLVWSSITEDGVTRLKEYVELTPAEAIQADCDIKAINIISKAFQLESIALMVKDLHYYQLFAQLHAYCNNKERHANEVRLMHERNSDPLALVASHQLTQPAYQSHLHTHPKSLSQLHVSPYQSSQFYQSTVYHNVYSPQPSIPQLEYAPTAYQQQQPEFSQPDSGLVVPVFQKGDDPIDAINHMMSFLTAVVTSRYPTTNNQLRTSSNPRQQATIYDGKVTVQPVQGRQTTYDAGTTRKYTPGASGSNTGKQRTVISQASGQALTEEEIAFLADPGLPDIQTSQTIALMANLSRNGSDALTESNDVSQTETEITSDSNIIPYLIRESKPKLYDGNTILKMDTIVVPDSDETLMLCEESRLKMILKEQDPMVAVEQHRLESRTFEVKINQVLNENESYLELKTELLNKKDFVDKETYDKLCKSFTTLEKHCLTLEADSQLNQENFQLENSVLNQNAPSFTQLFELSELRAQSQAKDTVIVKLKEQIKSLNGNVIDSTEQGLVIAALKNELRKLKGKAVDKEAIETHSVDPNVSKDNMEPITPKLLNKRTAHSTYIKHTQEEALVLRDIVEHVKANYPQDSLLESAFRYTKVIQDLLSHISRSCPSINNFGPQLIEVTPRKKDKKVRFAESLTSTENTKPDSTSNIVSNKRVLHSTGVRLSTSASGSQPSGNTRNDRILQTPSSNSKNKVEAHPRNVKSSLNKKNGTVKVNGSAVVQNPKKQDNSDYVCINSDDCMSSDNLCASNSMNDVKFRAKPKKSKSKKNKSKKDIWKPTGKVFTQIGYIWKPTGRTFTMVGNACPLTRITTTNEVPSRKPIVLESESPKPVVKLVYSRKPRKNKNTESVSKTKVVQFVLGICFSSTHMASFFNLEGVDLLTGSRGDNLYSLSSGIDAILSHLSTCQRTWTCNEKVDISHDYISCRSSQQNGVVDRRNRTLIEAARTMLIYAKAPLFMWAEAVATASDRDASDHSSSGPALHDMTPVAISSGLVPNPPPSTSFVPPSRFD